MDKSTEATPDAIAVDRILRHHSHEPVAEGCLLRDQVGLEEPLGEVPVGSVEQSHLVTFALVVPIVPFDIVPKVEDVVESVEFVRDQSLFDVRLVDELESSATGEGVLTWREHESPESAPDERRDGRHVEMERVMEEGQAPPVH